MRPKKKNIVLGTFIGLIAVVIIGIYLKPEQKKQEPALIGGEFELTNHLGHKLSSQMFSGKIMVLYFGYTFCPDVCPTDLQKLSMSLDILENENIDISNLQPLFITIDPERDTQDVMAEFVSNFHPSLIGLWGTGDQIKHTTSLFRVYYQKASEEEYYLMDHSSYIYVMGPEGEFLTHFTSLDTPEKIASKLEFYLDDLF